MAMINIGSGYLRDKEYIEGRNYVSSFVGINWDHWCIIHLIFYDEHNKIVEIQMWWDFILDLYSNKDQYHKKSWSKT